MLKKIMKGLIPATFDKIDYSISLLQQENADLREIILDLRKELDAIHRMNENLLKIAKQDSENVKSIYDNTWKIRNGVQSVYQSLSKAKDNTCMTDRKINELCEHYYRTEKDRFRRMELLLESHSYGVAETKRKEKIVVSLTSYPKRIGTLALVIDRLLNQTLKPDHLVLYLAKNNFSTGERELPERLIQMKKRGLEIRWCKNDIGSYKKIIPALKDFPEDIIITVDDDIYYEIDLVEKLYESYRKHSNAISAMRVHRIRFDDKKNLLSYNDWKMVDNDLVGRPAMYLFPTGAGGVLYPPHIFDEYVFNESIFMTLCPNADDIWLRFMTARKGVPVVLAETFRHLNLVEGSQEVALWNINKKENDHCIQRFLNQYNHISDDQETLLEKLYYDGDDLIAQTIED